MLGLRGVNVRDYRLKSSDLPSHVYAQVIAIVRGYDSMKNEYDAILHTSPDPPDGQPRGTVNPDTTSREGVIRADISQKLEAIEQSILIVPEDYRQGVWDNAVYGIPYPLYADRTTYWRYKAKFFRAIAKRMYWI